MENLIEKKVLFIQKDSPFVAEYIQFFKNKKWEVEHCISGASGLEKIATWEPDVIIVGQEVSGFNPFIVLKNISSVILSASQLLLFLADEDFLKKIERDHEKWEGVTSHIVKVPVNVEKLYEFCRGWNDETSRLHLSGVLYTFPKTKITEGSMTQSKKVVLVKEEIKKEEVKKELPVSSIDSNDV
ncbi:MAG: hypothetical protein HYY62_04830, partial [Deltaproteobacteria bacterium]|nr:hypothetical protein [Deltaproteobacteria bacterium]